LIRTLCILFLTCGATLCQQIAAPVEPPAPVPVVALDIAPLAPADLASPYASPRDAARHRFQVTLARLESTRNVDAAMQGFADALARDAGYASAAFNLGVVAAIAEKWPDALAALEEAARLDPGGLGKLAAPTVERLRQICSLEATPEGRLKRRYDEALFPVLQKLSKLQPAEAMEAIAEVGRIDPKRWEAPALLASLSGKGHGYEVAAKFLEIAASNATDPQLKRQLEKALEAARRELRYAAARAAADAAADHREYEQAASLYENAWATMPARAANGMEAASAWLLHDDTGRASATLIRLRESGDPELGPLAGAMLLQLAPIEPTAGAQPSDTREFFRDAGWPQPVNLSDLIPRVNTATMELLDRPLPKLVRDSEPVTLLAALSANPADAAQAALPELPAPRNLGENPWRELMQLRSAPSAQAASVPQERPVSTADISGSARMRRPLQISSQPPGARIFVGDALESLCETPCTLQAAARTYTVRASLAGYQEERREVRVTAKGAELVIPLALIRGNLIIMTPGPATLKVNGTVLANPSPVELSLAPGLYRITAVFESTVREQMLNLKPGSRLRLELRP
jgi:PEGA domain-containing protein